ncbi:MAG TPA: S41 family peptidase [Ignavibacteriaceae bacterium]|nr:S41 family peptidase [Ignavibacteriaceae bacterium]
MKVRNLKIPMSIILLSIGIVLGIQIEKIFSGDNLRESIIKFNDALTFTEKYYVEEVDTQKLVETAINGMLSDLDPHSVYIPPKQLESVEESFRGDFEGIGIEFQVVNDTLTVVSAISGGPSEALGIMAGDRIVKINGKEVIGITNDEVRQKLRGKAGTKVKVSIERPGIKGAIDYEITRDKIPLYSVDAGFMLDNKTGYISVSRFSETTYDEVVQQLKQLSGSGMMQLVLDLRGNPGGYLDQAVKMADLFIDGHKKIVFTKGRRSEFDDEKDASESSPYEKIPLIILVNRGSASASEIVSGAVQDWDRGLIVGETTFGKGLVQRQFSLPDNSALRLTISKYYTPSGRLIQRDYKHTANREDYYSEVTDRDEKEGDNLYHSAEKDSAKPVYKTHAGRIVYGGGGITPDYIVKSDNLTEYTINLLKNNLFYLYVLSYLDVNDKKIKEQYGNDLSKFINEFNFSADEIKKFREFSESKGVKYNEEQFKQDFDYISSRLKAQIARNYWKNEGWYSVMLKIDNQILQAENLFGEAKDLANLK